jgi:ADP-heptose:LPS heptosyltransferase
MTRKKSVPCSLFPVPSIKRIVVYRALFLGDLICATPALRALRRGFPDSEMTLIGLPWAREFVERLPYLDRHLNFPGYPGIDEVPYELERTERFLESAEAHAYDLAIQMHGDGHISNGFVAALGARYTLGYRRGRDTRLSHSLEYKPGEHEALRWLRLVAELGIDVSDTRLEFPITPEERERARVLLGEASSPQLAGPLIGLHPGAKDPARRWPTDRFAALGDALVEQWGARVVLTGAAGERDLTSAVRAAMRYPALDLAGATQIGEFAALIEALDLLVTNDTGASHLAAAAKTPSVVLFGPTRPEQWAPLDRALHLVIDAAALYEHVAPEQALQRLDLASVFAACNQMFESRYDLGKGAQEMTSLTIGGKV